MVFKSWTYESYALVNIDIIVETRTFAWRLANIQFREIMDLHERTSWTGGGKVESLVPDADG